MSNHNLLHFFARRLLFAFLSTRHNEVVTIYAYLLIILINITNKKRNGKTRKISHKVVVFVNLLKKCYNKYDSLAEKVSNYDKYWYFTFFMSPILKNFTRLTEKCVNLIEFAQKRAEILPQIFLSVKRNFSYLFEL